jgi:hypothetical protein
MLVKLLQMSSNAFQALLSVEFNFVLKSRSSNSCVICGHKNIPPLTLTSFILGNFYLKWANPSLSLSIAFTDFIIKASLMLGGGK